MKLLSKFIVLSGALLVIGTSHANAQVLGEVWVNQPVIGANATLANRPATAPDAKFFTPAIDFNSAIDGYALKDFLKNPTFFDTSAAFNPNNIVNNTYFWFTGQTFLNAGNNSFVVPHDDGLQLNIDGIGLVVNAPLPTAPVNTPFNVVAPVAGMYNFQLSYGEVAGPPAVLGFRINGQPVGGSVPDPSSTMLLLGLGVGALGCARRFFRA